MPSFQTFKDLSVTFKTHPITDDLVVVKDKTAIAQSISNILQTNPNERPFQPKLGSGIREVLFEPLDYGTTGILTQKIKQCLIDYEPRIRVLSVIGTVDYGNNGYNITLNYEIVGRDDDVISAEVFLERTR